MLGGCTECCSCSPKSTHLLQSVLGKNKVHNCIWLLFRGPIVSAIFRLVNFSHQHISVSVYKYALQFSTHFIIILEIAQTTGREMSRSGNVQVGKCPIGNCPIGICRNREMSIGKCPVGKCRSGNVCPPCLKSNLAITC